MLPFFQGLVTEMGDRQPTEMANRPRNLSFRIACGPRLIRSQVWSRIVCYLMALMLNFYDRSSRYASGSTLSTLGTDRSALVCGAQILKYYFAGLDFSDKNVLDIGCWDGLYSFHAEEKGASTIYATDLISARSYSEFPTFHLAHKLRSSKAKYYSNLSVYDLSKIQKTAFDVVIFAGVYYHLRDPLRALDSIRSVMKTNGTVNLIEGAILNQEGCFAKFYHDRQFCGDPTNWWVPTVDCLEQWVTSSGFGIIKSYAAGGHLENQRHILLARAT